MIFVYYLSLSACMPKRKNGRALQMHEMFTFMEQDFLNACINQSNFAKAPLI